ncbi:hypothetical protein OAL64_01435, partial [bacterium]|nr:hypothetical protein [bacterium]
LSQARSDMGAAVTTISIIPMKSPSCSALGIPREYCKGQKSQAQTKRSESSARYNGINQN